MQHVVIWDPKGVYWEGAIVDGTRARELESKGVALLPCEPELFGLAGFAGFAKRSWGSGVNLDCGIPQRHAPISVFYPGEPRRHLRWKGRLVGEPGQHSGTIRLAPIETYWNQMTSSLGEGSNHKNVVTIDNLPTRDEHGGWTIEGESLLYAANPGYYGFGIYGNAAGMRLAWLAITLTS